MKRWTAIPFLLAVGLGSTAAVNATANAAPPPQPFPVTVPSVTAFTSAPGAWDSRNAADIQATPQTQGVAAIVAEAFKADHQRTLPVRVGRASASGISLRVDEVASSVAGGYRITITNKVDIVGRDLQGVRNGAMTVLQALRSATQAGVLPRGTVTDSPRLGDRGQMIDVGRRYMPVEYLRQQIDQMAWFKMTTLHLHLTDWNGYRIESPSHPEIVSDQHYTLEELRDLDTYAQARGITIVPEIDVPGHSVVISQALPELALRCASMSSPTNQWEGSAGPGWTLDYTKKATRDVLKELIGEIAGTFSGPYLHIGTDEVPLQSNQLKCPELVTAQKAAGYTYVGDLLVDFINDLNETVKSHGKTTQVWQWWDYGSNKVSAGPSKDVVVNEWLSQPTVHANQGYRTVGSQDGWLYLSVGFGARPGDYAFFNVNRTYENYAFVGGENVLGYRVSRWSDKSYSLSNEFYDYLSRRPLAVVAERTWSAAAPGRASDFLDRYNQIGDAPLANREEISTIGANIGAAGPGLSTAGWSTTATSQETASEPGAATNATDNNPYTFWHSQWSGTGSTLPQTLSVDLGTEQRLSGARYTPRQDGGQGGLVRDYRIEVSTDGTTWKTAKAGTMPGPRILPGGPAPTEWSEQIVTFDQPVTARHVRFVVLTENGRQQQYASIASLDFMKAR